MFQWTCDCYGTSLFCPNETLAGFIRHINDVRKRRPREGEEIRRIRNERIHYHHDAGR